MAISAVVVPPFSHVGSHKISELETTPSIGLTQLFISIGTLLQIAYGEVFSLATTVLPPLYMPNWRGSRHITASLMHYDRHSYCLLGSRHAIDDVHRDAILGEGHPITGFTAHLPNVRPTEEGPYE